MFSDLVLFREGEKLELLKVVICKLVGPPRNPIVEVRVGLKKSV
jgi:hypothetical protein